MSRQFEWTGDLLVHVEDDLRGEAVTSTEILKARVRNLYRNVPVAQMDSECREKLALLKTQLLCRGYTVSRGKRDGVSFNHVGYVPDDAPAWQEVEKP